MFTSAAGKCRHSLPIRVNIVFSAVAVVAFAAIVLF